MIFSESEKFALFSLDNVQFDSKATRQCTILEQFLKVGFSSKTSARKCSGQNFNFNATTNPLKVMMKSTDIVELKNFQF